MCRWHQVRCPLLMMAAHSHRKCLVTRMEDEQELGTSCKRVRINPPPGIEGEGEKSEGDVLLKHVVDMLEIANMERRNLCHLTEEHVRYQRLAMQELCYLSHIF